MAVAADRNKTRNQASSSPSERLHAWESAPSCPADSTAQVKQQRQSLLRTATSRPLEALGLPFSTASSLELPQTACSATPGRLDNPPVELAAQRRQRQAAAQSSPEASDQPC